MALLAKEETTKELKDRFKEYAQFGMVLRYMKDEKVIDQTAEIVDHSVVLKP